MLKRKICNQRILPEKLLKMKYPLLSVPPKYETNYRAAGPLWNEGREMGTNAWITPRTGLEYTLKKQNDGELSTLTTSNTARCIWS